MWSPWSQFIIICADFEPIVAQGITCEAYPKFFDCQVGKDFAAKHLNVINVKCGDMVWVPEGYMANFSTFQAPTCKRDVKLDMSFVCYMPVSVPMKWSEPVMVAFRKWSFDVMNVKTAQMWRDRIEFLSAKEAI